MKSKEQKYEAILDRATSLDTKGKTETFLDVAAWLNKRGFTNNKGNAYCANSRGVAKVIATAWDYAKSNYGERKALPIANAFTRVDGAYAWTE